MRRQPLAWSKKRRRSRSVKPAAARSHQGREPRRGTLPFQKQKGRQRRATGLASAHSARQLKDGFQSFTFDKIEQFQ